MRLIVLVFFFLYSVSSVLAGTDSLRSRIDSLVAERALLLSQVALLDVRIDSLAHFYLDKLMADDKIPDGFRVPDGWLLPVEKPKVIKRYSPQYPRHLASRGITGTVVLKFIVNKKGRVEKIQVMSGPKVFHKSAIEAIKKTQFKPAMSKGKPFSAWMTQRFTFQ